jgi:hypothetical protein
LSNPRCSAIPLVNGSATSVSRTSHITTGTVSRCGSIAREVVVYAIALGVTNRCCDERHLLGLLRGKVRELNSRLSGKARAQTKPLTPLIGESAMEALSYASNAI